MVGRGLLQIGALVAVVVVLTPYLGRYLARVFSGGSASGDRVFLPVERTCPDRNTSPRSGAVCSRSPGARSPPRWRPK